MLSFNNCELHCCALDGYKGNREALLNRSKSISDYFNSKPGTTRYRIWYNMDDSVLTDDIIESITESLFKINDSIIKIAFIGANRKKKRFDKVLRKTTFNRPVCYFSDAELAKEWLI